MPLGSFILEATVFDSDGVSTSAYSDIICNIQLNNSINECDVAAISSINITYMFTDLIETKLSFSMLSTKSRYLYLLQSLQSILQYLDGINTNCINDDFDITYILYHKLINLLDIIHNYFGSQHTDLCQSGFVVVCCTFIIYRIHDLIVFWF